MSSNVKINIPAVAIVEPDDSYNSPVEVTAIAGSTLRAVSMPAKVNNGNVTRDFRITVSNVVNGTVTNVKLQNGANTVESSALTQTITVAPQGTVNATISFEFPAGAPGVPASQCTAVVTSEWV